jgi:hypothetical protein
MSRAPLSIEQILTILAENPPHIAGLAASLTPARLRPSPDEWCANEVLAHLHACAAVAVWL